MSERTVYRDIRDLLVSGVPIQGGGRRRGTRSTAYELPPLMFDEEEIEALVLCARIVRAWADKKLARAAEEALQKIEDEPGRTLADFLALVAAEERAVASSAAPRR